MYFNVVTGTGCIIHSGTLDQCWQHLVTTYGHISLFDLWRTGIRVVPV